MTTKNKDIVPVEQKTGLPQKAEMKTKIAAPKSTGEVKSIITTAKAFKVVAKDAKNRQAIAERHRARPPR